MLMAVEFWADRCGETIYRGIADVVQTGPYGGEFRGEGAFVADTDMQRLGDFLGRMEGQA